MKTLIVSLILTLSALAQTAKVVTLKQEEAAKARQLHEAAAAAQKASDDFDAQIAQTYTQSKAEGIVTWSPNGSHTAAYINRDGWDYGFEYSEDFKFIVPKPYQAKAPEPCGFSSIIAN